MTTVLRGKPSNEKQCAGRHVLFCSKGHRLITNGAYPRLSKKAENGHYRRKEGRHLGLLQKIGEELVEIKSLLN